MCGPLFDYALSCPAYFKPATSRNIFYSRIKKNKDPIMDTQCLFNNEKKKENQ